MCASMFDKKGQLSLSSGFKKIHQVHFASTFLRAPPAQVDLDNLLPPLKVVVEKLSWENLHSTPGPTKTPPGSPKVTWS